MLLFFLLDLAIVPESAGQYRLAQHLGSLQIRVDLGFNRPDDRGAPVDLGDDKPLFVKPR